MFGKVWKIIAGVGAGAAALFFALYKVSAAQRDAAKEREKRAIASKEAVQSARKTEKQLRQARDNADKSAASVEQDLSQRKKSGSRKKTFGDPRTRRNK